MMIFWESRNEQKRISEQAKANNRFTFFIIPLAGRCGSGGTPRPIPSRESSLYMPVFVAFCQSHSVEILQNRSRIFSRKLEDIPQFGIRDTGAFCQIFQDDAPGSFYSIPYNLFPIIRDFKKRIPVKALTRGLIP